MEENKMTIQEYQNLTSVTMADLGTPLLNNLHMILGFSTESGEIADVFKRELAYKKDPDMVNVKEELGDLMWYVSNMCNINGWDLRDILCMNIEKLKARYPDGFTTDAALNRNTDNERKVLEKHN